MFFQPTYSVSCCIATARSRVFEEHFLGGGEGTLALLFLRCAWTSVLEASPALGHGPSLLSARGPLFEAEVPPGYHAGSRRPKQPQSCVNPQKGSRHRLDGAYGMP